MSRFVIVAYTPKPGWDAVLLKVLARHERVLRDQELITERPAYLMRCAGGAYIEVFEWRSAKAIEQAHSNPAVQALWREFDAACQYTPLAHLEEAKDLFAEFEPVALNS